MALSGLRRNVSQLRGERLKVAKEHARVVAQHEEHKQAVSKEESKKLVRCFIFVSQF